MTLAINIFLWLAVSVLAFIAAMRGRSLFNEATRAGVMEFILLLPRIGVGVVGSGFVAEALPNEWIAPWLGPASGLLGVVIATLGGALTPGGPVVGFSIGAAALKSGAGAPQVIAYSTAWALYAIHRLIIWEVPMMPPRVVWQVISEEQLRKAEEYVQQEEGAANRLAGWVGVAVTGIAVVMTLFHLYAAYDIVPTQELRYIHVAFVLLLSFLLFPLASRFRNHVQWFDVIPALAGIGIIIYALAGGDDFLDRAAVPDRWDVILGSIFIVLVLEAARRTTGPIMPVVAILFIAYAMFGPYLPPPWTHRGFDIARLVGHLFITLEGIFGVAVDVSATLIIMFTI